MSLRDAVDGLNVRLEGSITKGEGGGRHKRRKRRKSLFSTLWSYSGYVYLVPLETRTEQPAAVGRRS